MSSVTIPPRAILFGVTGRVVDAITGAAQSWSLGVAGDAGRFGTGLGVASNAWVNGPAAPIVYWEATPLLLSAQGGGFRGRHGAVDHPLRQSQPTCTGLGFLHWLLPSWTDAPIWRMTAWS
ncbi:MAG: hypothetical protein O3A97_03655 [Proteobacteria bacterium]|nr:hypothetical protein [Pseudomonadota bacterium]